MSYPRLWSSWLNRSLSASEGVNDENNDKDGTVELGIKPFTSVGLSFDRKNDNDNGTISGYRTSTAASSTTNTSPKRNSIFKRRSLSALKDSSVNIENNNLTPTTSESAFKKKFKKNFGLKKNNGNELDEDYKDFERKINEDIEYLKSLQAYSDRDQFERKLNEYLKAEPPASTLNTEVPLIEKKEHDEITTPNNKENEIKTEGLGEIPNLNHTPGSPESPENSPENPNSNLNSISISRPVSPLRIRDKLSQVFGKGKRGTFEQGKLEIGQTNSKDIVVESEMNKKKKKEKEEEEEEDHSFLKLGTTIKTNYNNEDSRGEEEEEYDFEDEEDEEDEEEESVISERDEPISRSSSQIVRKKSSLKFTSALTYDELEREIFEQNPMIKCFDLFPENRIKNSKGIIDSNISTTYRLPFTWIVWLQRQSYSNFSFDPAYNISDYVNPYSNEGRVYIDKAIETIGEVNDVVDDFKESIIEDANFHIYLFRFGLKPKKSSIEMSKAGSLEIKIPIIGESRFDMWTFIVNIVLSDVLYRPIDIQEPVLGIAWKNEKNNNSYSILTFYFARNHLDKSDKELIQLSKFIHFVRNCLPFELKEIIQEPNMLYCNNETRELMQVKFVE